MLQPQVVPQLRYSTVSTLYEFSSCTNASFPWRISGRPSWNRNWLRPENTIVVKMRERSCDYHDRAELESGKVFPRSYPGIEAFKPAFGIVSNATHVLQSHNVSHKLRSLARRNLQGRFKCIYLMCLHPFVNNSASLRDRLSHFQRIRQFCKEDQRQVQLPEPIPFIKIIELSKKGILPFSLHIQLPGVWCEAGSAEDGACYRSHWL